MLGEDV
jgi:hypothetical protein